MIDHTHLDSDILTQVKRRREQATCRSLAEDVGVSRNLVSKRLRELERQGLIERGVGNRIVRAVGKAATETI